MSNYIQFKVAYQNLKVDGKDYKAGDPFPFEAGNESHRRMWRQGMIVEENTEATKGPAKKATKK